MKKIFVIGSTGNIGNLVLDLVESHIESFEVIGLVANSNVEEISKQANKFKPKFIGLLENIKENCSTDAIFLSGVEEVINVLENEDIDIVVLANSGSIGAKFLVASAKQKNRRVLVANKESIIMLGELLYDIVNNNAMELIPLDSEHNSLFQLLNIQPNVYPLVKNHSSIKELIITASGGPFLKKDKSELKYITPEMAINHPNWKMGAKISVDSATLANKALEMIELKVLFGVPSKKIKAIIHPQSIVHSLVNFIDGTVFANFSNPDMKIPISNGLFYPDRINLVNNLDLKKGIEFLEIDKERFPIIKLVEDILEIGGDSFIYFNVINEKLVESFLHKQISFLDITEYLLDIMGQINFSAISSIEEVFEVEKKAKMIVKDYLKIKMYN